MRKSIVTGMHTMNKRTSIEQNRVFHLEDSVIMYGVYKCRYIRKINTNGT